jgi:hypothetical protein
MSTDENSKNLPSIEEQRFSQRELKLLEEVKESGARPISATLAAEMYHLFLEGYSCGEIAKQNLPLTEGDVLYCRSRFKWDDEKDLYAFELQRRVKEKLMKTKLESLEFLSNTLAASHKYHNQKLLKYLQSGKDEDKPENLISGTTSYKAIIETIAKLTGEDRIQKIESKSSVDVNIKNDDAKAISKELHSQILAELVKNNKVDK